ncbi:unnamed protein product [Owenia fusiformis]|uniref:Uncharacterized protein n=1 Tax=Owenia fusiformis TaxID=6347 RepID=A0A8J1V0L9_OWEFU|nr:unnamed protein product [Owenia fusiformis]
MPYSVLRTSVKREEVTSEFLKGLSETLAKCFGYGIKRIAVEVHTDLRIMVGGEIGDAPYLFLYMVGVGIKKADVSNTPSLEYVQGAIPSAQDPDRFLLNFHPQDPDLLGMRGTTVTEVLWQLGLEDKIVYPEK